jgi:hypothetical protein
MAANIPLVLQDTGHRIRDTRCDCQLSKGSELGPTLLQASFSINLSI